MNPSQRNPSQRHGSENPAGLLEEPHPIRASEPRLQWRQGFLASDALLLVLGVWLIISPLVLPYGTGDGWWLPILCGTGILAMAAASLAEIFSKKAAGWAIMAIAAILFAGGLVPSDSIEPSWNAAAGGALAAFLSLISLAAAGEDGDDHSH